MNIESENLTSDYKQCYMCAEFYNALGKGIDQDMICKHGGRHKNNQFKP